ncbi:MAG: recombination protein RecR [Deltaproteobacteria bacterium]|nr:recombination protein RecR [Deltaproteobacteria bacterium]
MADILPKPLQRLILVLAKLPGVGSRTAMRYALHLVREGSDRLEELSAALDETRREVSLCPSCFGMSEGGGLCPICASPERRGETLCVVEGIGDMPPIESAAQYAGRYFVLHKLLSPLKGVGPQELHLDRLLDTVRDHGIAEVVLATPLTTDGEATATYLSRLLTQEGVRVTRLAAGVPVGGAIEYLDRLTLSRAFQDRKEL